MYENYIFDLYGTLVDINTNEWKASLWKNMAMIYSLSGASYTPGKLRKAYDHYLAEEIAAVPEEKYTTDPEPLVDNIFEKLYTSKGVECSPEIVAYTARVFRALTIKYIKLYEGVRELFDAIRAHGGKIYLLSNAQRSFTEPEIRMLGIYDEFDDILISSDEGCAKPDEMFFRRVIERHGLDVSKSVMIGNDCNTDIGGANRVGMDSLYLHTNISPEVTGEVPAKYVIMSGSLIEARKALFGE